MNPNSLYENYEEALAARDFFAAIELLKQYISQKSNATMEYYWLGYALMSVHLYAEAGLYLRQALLELDAETPLAAQTAEIYVTKASIYALLKEKDICLQHIYTALWLKPTLFDTLKEDVTLQQNLQEHDWKQIQATQYYRFAADIFTQNGWQVAQKSPDRPFLCNTSHVQNPHWELHLTYDAFEHTGSVLLQSKQELSDNYLYHFRPFPNDFTWIDVLSSHQSLAANAYWSNLSESLIEACQTVVWEMSDGRRIKIG